MDYIYARSWSVVTDIAVGDAKAHLTDPVRRAQAREDIVLHPARLNWGDCFSYGLAKQRGCLLPVAGTDFSQTDIIAA